MRRSSPASSPAPNIAQTSDEHWTVVQVASHLAIPYQSARNQMLEGRFGESHYDAKSRKLTVSAALVIAAKAKRGRPKKRSARRAR